MKAQNEQLKEALKKTESIEEMTMNLISDYNKLKLCLEEIRDGLQDRGGFDIQIASINKTLNEVQ